MVRSFSAIRAACAALAITLLSAAAAAQSISTTWKVGDGGTTARTDIFGGQAGQRRAGGLRLFCKEGRHLQFAVEMEGSPGARLVVTDGVANESPLFEARLSAGAELPNLPAAVAFSRLLRTTIEQYDQSGYGDEDMYLGIEIGGQGVHYFSLLGFREARERLLKGCGSAAAPAVAQGGGSYAGSNRIFNNCRQRNSAEQCRCAVTSIKRFALSKRQQAGPNVVPFMFEGAAAMIDNIEKGRSQDASISAVTLIAMRHMVHARMASSFAPVQMVAQSLMRAEQECRLR